MIWIENIYSAAALLKTARSRLHMIQGRTTTTTTTVIEYGRVQVGLKEVKAYLVIVSW